MTIFNISSIPNSYIYDFLPNGYNRVAVCVKCNIPYFILYSYYEDNKWKFVWKNSKYALNIKLSEEVEKDHRHLSDVIHNSLSDIEIDLCSNCGIENIRLNIISMKIERTNMLFFYKYKVSTKDVNKIENTLQKILDEIKTNKAGD